MTDVQTDRIRTDGGTQPRCQINMFVVDEYAEAIEAGAEMPPPVVFFDGEDYWLADGFHRFRAYAKLGRESIPCDVNQGDRRDAVHEQRPPVGLYLGEVSALAPHVREWDGRHWRTGARIESPLALFPGRCLKRIADLGDVVAEAA